MSLENSLNSSAEFGEFSKLRFKRKISLTWENSANNSGSKSPNAFVPQKNPNSELRVSKLNGGEFSKLSFFFKNSRNPKP